MRFISKLVDQNFNKNWIRVRKERKIAPQASAGNPLSIKTLPEFRKESFGDIAQPSATGKKRVVPCDCKQDDFSFGLLKLLIMLNRPPLLSSTNLEMTLK
jgi:hypothetical protein